MQIRFNVLTIYIEGVPGNNSCHISDQFITMEDWKCTMYDEVKRELRMDANLDEVHYGNHFIRRDAALACRSYDELADRFDINRAIKMDRLSHEFILCSSHNPAIKKHIHILRQ